MKLNQDLLTKLEEKLIVPNYNREKSANTIVHIGVGGFHRAHQAYYLDQLLHSEKSEKWTICGVGIRKEDRVLIDHLNDQDGLYTLIEQHSDGNNKCRVVGSITSCLFGPDDPNEVIQVMGSEKTKIISLTITEGGYNFNSNTGEFDFENPDILKDLVNLERPNTVFGYLTSALKIRKENGLPAFTILSCDNIQHNGDVTKKMLLSFVRKIDSSLANWIEQNVSFPNSMVDRITPAFASKNKSFVEDQLGYTDECPVVCEPFIQWVVEDNFTNGRPNLEEFGVQFVKDVTPYEKMKIRLLNAGHSVLGIPGAVYGHRTIEDCMNDVVFERFMKQFLDKEVTPILDPIEGICLDKYKELLRERFSNPNIKDQVSRICSESSSKLPKFLIPTLKENLAAEGSIQYATFVLAVWCYYSDLQKDRHGNDLEILDKNKKALHQAAHGSIQGGISFLKQSEIFGDLANQKRFVKAFESMRHRIYVENDIRNLMAGML